MQTKLIAAIFFFYCGFLSAAESFEGIIEYEIETQSNNEKIPASLLKEAYGSGRKTYYKNGYMKSAYIGGLAEWETYVSSKNKQFVKLKADSKPVVYDGGSEERRLVSFTDRESDLSILDMNTRLVTIEYENGDISRYWYSPKIYINPIQFGRLRFAFINQYWETSKAPYLRHEMDNGKWKVIYTATKVKHQKLDDDLFSFE